MQSFIGLGGNIGNVQDTFRSALNSLDSYPDLRVKQVSSNYLTPPMGDEAGVSYLNAVAELEVAFSPLELLDILQSVELKHGRERSANWGPRTLDLDLLLFGDTILASPRLILPHSGCWYRRFVLDPFAEIAPGAIHPVKAVTIQELRDRILERPLTIGLTGGEPAECERLIADLSQTFSNVLVKSWTPGDGEPALLLWLGLGPDDSQFDDLPLLPSLDLTRFQEIPAIAARHVIAAAMGS